MTSELEKRAEEEIGATYESELPAECVPKKPDMTVALVKYMKRLFYAGADYGAKAERERIWAAIQSLSGHIEAQAHVAVLDYAELKRVFIQGDS